MNIHFKSTVGSIVAADYRTASVFSEYQIDFCCKGARTVEEVCGMKEINPEQLIGKLHAVLSVSGNGSPDFISWPADLVVDFIEKKHHRYVADSIPVLSAYLEKIASVHGKNHPELFQILNEFKGCAGALTKHMKKEELILFPYIRKMYNAIELKKVVSPMTFDFIEDPIRAMHVEHDTEGERFRKISYLSQNYTPPADACTTYRVAFKMLADFEDDLHRHIHLENNILFPMALKMERQMRYEPTH